MKNLFYLALSVLLVCSCSGKKAQTATAEAEAAPQKTQIEWATFNIRMDTDADGQNSWSHRKDSVCKFIRDKQIDIVGMQEVLHHQLEDLKAGLPGYAAIGVGREDGKTKGEYSAILYRTDKFDVLASNTFWLSQYPDSVGFIGWDGACTRVATWAKFKDKATGKIFMGVNTHFDHVGVEARKNGALLIIDSIKTIVGDQPAVLTGDFNVADDSEAYRTLTTNAFVLKDAHKIAEVTAGPAYTFHDYGRQPVEERHKIDFIFVTPQIHVLRSEIAQEPAGPTGYLSDHNPQVVQLEF